MTRLREEKIVCAEMLLTKGRSIRGIASELGMDESTPRNRLKRLRAKTLDGRRGKSEACAAFDALIVRLIGGSECSASSTNWRRIRCDCRRSSRR
jgi:transposase-like protein